MIPHNRPWLGHDEEEAALRVVRSGYLAQGPEVAAFEDEICAFLGLPPGHAVALSSGTAALFLALHTLDAKGRSVAFPAYSCSALRHATAFAGGREIVLDSRSDLPHARLPEDDVAADLVIAVHCFGIPQRLSPISGTRWIEDCAHAFGATIGGRPAGLEGAAAIVSFYATKLMTSGGGGGALFSSDRALVDQARDFREFDQRRDSRTRFNLQMTDLQAAVGRAQLKRLPEFLARRREIYDRYLEAGLPLIDSSSSDNEWRDSDVRPVRYRAVIASEDPQGVLAKLRAGGITAIVPVQEWELLGDPDSYPNARGWTRRSVSLPCYPALLDEEVERIIQVLAA